MTLLNVLLCETPSISRPVLPAGQNVDWQTSSMKPWLLFRLLLPLAHQSLLLCYTQGSKGAVHVFAFPIRHVAHKDKDRFKGPLQCVFFLFALSFMQSVPVCSLLCPFIGSLWFDSTRLPVSVARCCRSTSASRTQTQSKINNFNLAIVTFSLYVTSFFPLNQYCL